MTATPMTITEYKAAARDLFAPRLRAGWRPAGMFPYHDASGAILFARVRLDPPAESSDEQKMIRPIHKAGGAWKVGEPPLPAGSRPLYRLPQLLSRSGRTIWVVEGERKADALAKLGMLVTTSGGAASADAADWSPCANAPVIVWPDNDEPGVGYARAAAAKLEAVGCSVRFLDVPALGLAKSGDAVDWLAAHPNSTSAEIEALPVSAMLLSGLPPADNTAPHALADAGFIALDFRALLAANFKPQQCLLTPWLTTQSLTMLYAWRGVGKTHAALNIAYAVASGGAWLHWKANQPRKVLYLDGEMPGAALQQRVEAIRSASALEPQAGFLRVLTPDMQPHGVTPNLATAEGRQAVTNLIEPDTALIIVDNLSALVRGGGRENEAESWECIADWALPLRAQGHAICFIHHSGKNGAQRGTSKREDILDAVLCLRRPSGYVESDGARFEIHFEKARGLMGDDVRPVEAALSTDAEGRSVWASRPVEDAEVSRAADLKREGASQAEISEEMKKSRHQVNRLLKRAEAGGLIDSALFERGGKPQRGP